MFAALQRSAIPQQFGAIVVLERSEEFDATTVATTLADRICTVPRLRQRLVHVPLGCGRSIWVDDPKFAVEEHIDVVACPAPGDEPTLLSVAADLLMHRLSMDRPPWRASVVTGLSSGRVALILVVQHALADGLGGLAVLGSLVDGAGPTVERAFPIRPPSVLRLVVDALLIRGLCRVPARVRAVLHDLRRPHSRRIGRAAACSLLTATGDQRRLAVVRAQLDDLRKAAHQQDATINDVVLSAVAGALETFLERRGEQVDTIVVGVPAAIRRTAGPQELGNQLCEIRAAIPITGPAMQRLGRVARIMQDRKQTPLPLTLASAAVRALAAVGIYDWYMRRQRYLHTVVTDLAGPAQSVTFGGNVITDLLPMAVGGGGNVAVKFAALSYAGTLAIVATADPTAMPDLDALAADLRAELNRLARPDFAEQKLFRISDRG